MDFFGLQKLTLLDYPGQVACTVFTGGCNFRCPYCHNGGLVHPGSSPLLSEEELLAFLKTRTRKLEGITVSGGEPTIHADLPEFLHKVKALGFLVKLDTNGQSPKMLRSLFDKGLVDYVAMDIKNCRSRYAETVGVPGLSIAAIEESVQLLMNGTIPYEFRTTLCKELHDETAVSEIGQWLKGCKAYYLQPYRDAPEVLTPGVYHAPSAEALEKFRSILLPDIPNVLLRGNE